MNEMVKVNDSNERMMITYSSRKITEIVAKKFYFDRVLKSEIGTI